MAVDKDRPKSLEFTNLPLVEVSTRLVIEQQLDLTLAKVFNLAKILEDRFPGLEEPNYLALAPGVTSPPQREPGKLLTAHFIAMPPDIRLVLQSNMLLWNWNRVTSSAGETTKYGRYPMPRDDLLWFADLVRDHVATGTLTVKSLNMGYINFIASDRNSFEETVGHYLSPHVGATSMMRGSPFVHEILLNARTQDGLDRKLKFSTGTTATGKETEKGYVLATNIGAFVKDDSSPTELLDQIHEELQSFFLSILSEKALEDWGYRP